MNENDRGEIEETSRCGEERFSQGPSRCRGNRTNVIVEIGKIQHLTETFSSVENKVVHKLKCFVEVKVGLKKIQKSFTFS